MQSSCNITDENLDIYLSLNTSEPFPLSFDVLTSFEDFSNFTALYFKNVSLRDILFHQNSSQVLAGQRIWTFFFWITFVVGMAGNLLVVYVLLRRQEMHTVTNMFLLNLGIVDILYLLATIPSTANWTNYWPFAEFLCK